MILIGVGGFGGLSYSVEHIRDGLMGDKILQYVVYDYDSTKKSVTEITVAGADLAKFEAKLLEIGVNDWKRSYEPEGRVFDGASWTAKILFGQIECWSGGVGSAFAPNFGEFLDAVSELIGGLTFE